MIELGIVAVAAAFTWRSTGATGKTVLGIAVVAALVSAALPRSPVALGISIVTLLCAAAVLIGTGHDRRTSKRRRR